jgi:predicted RNA binding protein YcfA (HicA-like mRNA interferase family)
MGRLANISGKEAVKVFLKFGWYIVGQVGSHVVLSKTGVNAIPKHNKRQLQNI